MSNGRAVVDSEKGTGAAPRRLREALPIINTEGHPSAPRCSQDARRKARGESLATLLLAEDRALRSKNVLPMSELELRAQVVLGGRPDR